MADRRLPDRPRVQATDRHRASAPDQARPLNERLYRVTSIGRPIDRIHPTNRAISALTLGVALVDGLVRMLAGSTPPEAFVGALVVAAAFFLAWAIGREIDPDHDVSAFVAAGLSVAPSLGLGRPDFAGLFLVLLALRIVNRTVGPAAKPWDTVLILLLVVLAAWRGHPALSAFAFAAFLADGMLRPPYRPHLFAAAFSLGIAVWAARADRGVADAGASLEGWAALATALPVLVLAARSGEPVSEADAGGGQLRAPRIRAAQLLGLGTLAALILTEGRAGLTAVSPVWAALAGAGACSVLRRAGGRP
jgi:hypothetical protein